MRTIRRLARAVRLLVRDERIPRPLKWLATLGLAPVPGPFDETILLVVGVVLLVFFRQPLRDAWSKSGSA